MARFLILDFLMGVYLLAAEIVSVMEGSVLAFETTVVLLKVNQDVLNQPVRLASG
jgi:hypothetical protein